MGRARSIQVAKDHSQVTATWNITVDNPELIASFTLNVEGKALDTNCSSGNSQCNGAAQTTLSKPDQDCPVSFVITTNAPEEKHGDDVLRGNRTLTALRELEEIIELQTLWSSGSFESLAPSRGNGGDVAEGESVEFGAAGSKAAAIVRYLKAKNQCIRCRKT